MDKTLRILGIDPGSRKTGFGVVDQIGNRTVHVESGFIRLDTKANLSERLFSLSLELGKIIKNYTPDCGSIEQIFFAKNAKSALTLGHARGVILLKFAEQMLPIFEYAPLKVKQTIVGVGRADKAQVQHMVKILLNLHQPIQEDEADALAIALTHAHLVNSPKT